MELTISDPPEVLNLSIDIHNDHVDTHILLWEGQGPFGDDNLCVADESCLFNTEYFRSPFRNQWQSQGRASGVYWGFTGDPQLILQLKGPLESVSNV